MFDKNERVVAVGPYMNCEIHPHIQSFFIALDNRGIEVLKDTWRCQKFYEDKTDWILNTEVVKIT